MNKTFLRFCSVLAAFTIFAFTTALAQETPVKTPPVHGKVSKASSKGTTSAKKAGPAPKKTQASAGLLRDVSKKYRTDKVVKITTSKKVTSELLGKTTNYEGTIYLAQGKFRWENQTPEESLLLFDGTTIYNIQYPPKDLGGPVQVAKAKLDKRTKSQILITTLLGTQPIDKNFVVVKTSANPGMTSLELKPLTGDLRVKELSLNIDTQAKLIRTISYKDDVNNLTTIELTKTEFLKKENKDLFKFKIPKDAQVTNL
jgi:outer membrane lipoprotein carrier protein